MINVIASDDFAELDNREILTPASDAHSSVLREALPSEGDLRAEMQRAVRAVVPHVEFMPTGHGRNLTFEKDGFATTYQRRKQYAWCSISGEVVYGGALLIDEVRAACLGGARRIGERIGSEVWGFCGRGIGITPVTVRTMHDVATPRYVRRYGDEQPTILASMMRDEIVIRLAAYYFIAPPGEEQADGSL